MRPIARIVALCLALALAGCGGGPRLVLTPGAWCAAQSPFVELTNAGAQARRYTGWRLIDSSGIYHLPAFELQPGEALRVWRGAGQGDDHNLYLAQPQAAWDRSEQITAERGVWPFGESTPVFSAISCDLPSP